MELFHHELGDLLRLDLVAFQLGDNMVDHRANLLIADRTLPAGLANRLVELLPVERLTRAIALDHLNLVTVNLLIGREPMSASQTLLRYRYENPTENYNTDIVNAILQAMLYEMMNLIGRTAKPEDSHIIRQGERLFKKFMELLVNDKVRSRSVSNYSERLCVTSKYLSAVCKQLTGRTASSWINEFVIKDVVRQLCYTDLSIKEISLRLGFPNVSFFGKYVKNQLGMSPSEYRKMNVKE